MTRRMLDSGIWANEHFASLPAMARLLEIGIINMADDQGRMKAHPAYVRSQVFPYDDVTTGQVIDWLNLMAANGTVKLYEVDGKAYLQLVNWWEYQPLDWARPSEYPAPAGWRNRIRYNAKGGIHLCHNWTTRTGTPMADTCDCRGNPLVATPTEPPAIPTPPTDATPALQTIEVPAQVATPGSYADKYRSDIDHDSDQDQDQPKEKENEDEEAPDQAVASVFTAWDKNIPGTMTAILKEHLLALLDECGEPAVLHGITASVTAGARNFNYIAKCARNHAAGLDPARELGRRNGNPLSKSEQTMANFDEYRRLHAAGNI